VVALAEREGKPMDKLTIEQLQGVDNRIGKDVLEVFNYERSVEMKSAIGGTSKSAVKEQIRILKDITGVA
jgi:argininosuccinate lyase